MSAAAAQADDPVAPAVLLVNFYSHRASLVQVRPCCSSYLGLSKFGEKSSEPSFNARSLLSQNPARFGLSQYKITITHQSLGSIYKEKS